MIKKRPATALPVKPVHLASQSEHDRLAMVMMQLDMALALARENRMPQLQQYLEMALVKARVAQQQQHN